MILDEIASYARIRVAEQKKEKSLEQVKKGAVSLSKDTGFPFKHALKKQGMSFICEVKKASPSKGMIDMEFPYMQIAKEYEAAGAAAISVLTEPKYFKGQDSYLQEIAKTVKIPILRKDFTIDAYQIYEAKILGASAVLLICAILDEETLKEYIEIANNLGLSSLVEAHTKEEVLKALQAGAEIIGVNNRNLKTFKVDTSTSLQLREFVPKDKIYVSESGIRMPEDIRDLWENHVDAVLIGETLMKSPDKEAEMKHLNSLLTKQDGEA